MVYDTLSLRKHGGGAMKCYLGTNLRSKTSLQHPVQNLITAPCTKFDLTSVIVDKQRNEVRHLSPIILLKCTML